MAPAPTLQDLLADVHRDAASDEPLMRLETAARTVRSLSDVGDAALGYFVDQARRAGHSWAEIGDAVGECRSRLPSSGRSPGAEV